MLYRIRDKINRLRFSVACRAILTQKPVLLDQRSKAILFSQLQHKDLLMALIAIKSFSARVRIGQVKILDDGSLTQADYALLKEHVPGVEVLEMETVRTAKCPTGGCWERLLWIARLSRDNYVIQLDADTLTVDYLPEIESCVAANRSFAIGTWANQEVETMAFRQSEATNVLATKPTNPHIQILSESRFDGIDNFRSLKYIRGCAGFSGFAAGSVDISFIENVSSQMFKAMDKKWSLWGTEQVMSNIVVANGNNPMVLPFPKYTDCTDIRLGTTAFVHFIGSCRFTSNRYMKMALQSISQLDKG